MHCALCRESLSSSGNYVECRGCCLEIHFECAKITESSYRSLGRERKKNWRCANCRAKKEELISRPGDNMEKTDMDANTSMLLEMKQLMERLECKVDQCLSGQKKLSEDYDKLCKGMENIVRNVDGLQSKISILDGEQKAHAQILRMQDERLQQVEWISKRDEILINGLPSMDSRTLNETVLDICRRVGVDVNKDNVTNIFQSGHRQGRQSSLVVVKFSDSNIRDMLIKRKKSVVITKADLLNENVSGQIFLSDNLSPTLVRLKRETKEVAKRFGWKYVWVRDGKLFARKDDDFLLTHIEDTDSKWIRTAKTAYQACVQNYRQRADLAIIFEKWPTHNLLFQLPFDWTDLANIEYSNGVPFLVDFKVVSMGPELILELRVVKNAVFDIQLEMVPNPRTKFLSTLLHRMEERLYGIDKQLVKSLKNQCIAAENERFLQELQNNREKEYFGRYLTGNIQIRKFQDFLDVHFPSCQLNWLAYIDKLFPYMNSTLTEESWISVGDYDNSNRVFNRIEVFCKFRQEQPSSVLFYVLFHLYIILAPDVSSSLKRNVNTLHTELGLTHLDGVYFFSRNIQHYCVLKFMDENDTPGFSSNTISVNSHRVSNLLEMMVTWKKRLLKLVNQLKCDSDVRAIVQQLEQIQIVTYSNCQWYKNNILDKKLPVMTVYNNNHQENSRIYRALKRNLQLSMIREKVPKIHIPPISPYHSTLYYDDTTNSIVVSELLLKYATETENGSYREERLLFFLTELLVDRLLLLKPDFFKSVYVNVRDKQAVNAETCLIRRYQYFVHPYFSNEQIDGKTVLRQSLSDTITGELFVSQYIANHRLSLLGGTTQKLKFQKYFNQTMENLCEYEADIPQEQLLSLHSAQKLHFHARMNAMFSNLKQFGELFECLPHDHMNIDSPRCRFQRSP